MSGQIKGQGMPAQVSELKVRDIRVRLHRAGRGPTVLFLHGAGGVPQWLPFFDALAERYELLVPEHPGFGGSDDPPWITSMAGPRDVLSRPRRGDRARPRPPDRQLARRLARGRDPDPRPLALPQPRSARAGRHPGQGRAVRRQFHLGARGGGAQPLPRPVLRRPHPGSNAERRADGRDAAEPLYGGEARLAAALVQSRPREVAAPHQIAGARRLGRRRQDHAAGLCRRCGTSGCRMRGS